jgi:hypothetical protein
MPVPSRPPDDTGTGPQGPLDRRAGLPWEQMSKPLLFPLPWRDSRPFDVDQHIPHARRLEARKARLRWRLGGGL